MARDHERCEGVGPRVRRMPVRQGASAQQATAPQVRGPVGKIRSCPRRPGGTVARIEGVLTSADRHRSILEVAGGHSVSPHECSFRGERFRPALGCPIQGAGGYHVRSRAAVYVRPVGCAFGDVGRQVASNHGLPSAGERAGREVSPVPEGRVASEAHDVRVDGRPSVGFVGPTNGTEG